MEQSRTHVERCPAPIRAVARMRIARVQSVKDAGQARVTFEMALDEIRSLSGRERQVIFEQAQQIAAAIAPELLREIPSVRRFPNMHHAEALLSTMLAHGHIDAAFDYVVQCDVPFDFPFGYAGNLMQKLDEDRQRTVLRCAIDAWRTPPDAEQMRVYSIPYGDGSSGINSGMMLIGQHQNHFIRFFQHRWKVLPAEEALAVVHEIVNTALEGPDLGTSSGYPDVHITSSRARVFFEVLHILRALDPALAESLIASHEQLAAAAQRYPNGIETMHQEFERTAEERRKQLAASGETCTGGFMMTGGDPRDIPRQKALLLAAQAGDYEPSLDYALELYHEDIDPDSPNQAPKAFWPSSSRFRTILYDAGKRLGPDAVTLLERIPDAEIRLFAQIEFAAALAGLPAARETSMKQRRRPPMQSRR